jgi:hypothetical protein
LEDELSILVWNLNGLTNTKRSDKDFLSILSDNDIIVLRETLTDKNSNMSIEGYHCYNLYRKFKHKRAGRNSSGMSIYVRECFNQGVSIVKNNFDTIVWLKFDCDFFNFDKDVYLCCLYLSPAANVIDANLFDVIEQDVFNFEQSGRVYVAGDLTCRIGNEPDYIVCEIMIRTFMFPIITLSGPRLIIHAIHAVTKCLTCVKQPVCG